MSSHEGSERTWKTTFRAARHNPCLMAPISVIMLGIFACFWLLTLLFQTPGILLGFILSPIIQRTAWYVEFLYPWSIARWGHLMLIKFSQRMRKTSSDDKNRGFHSRTLEQRYELVAGRVYVHPLPQFLDNVGYLVVCLPKKEDKGKRSKQPILAMVVDCGDADAVLRQIEMIRDLHYTKYEIQLQTILSTHKHHDHTAGNRKLVASSKTVLSVVGGAVEKVPCCNSPVADGDFLTLPCDGTNDMNDVVEIEVVAVPGHTRGSVAYIMRAKDIEPVAFLFTGDTMFSGGGGVPFESDITRLKDVELKNKTANTWIRPSAGNNSIERSFAELLSRGIRSEGQIEFLSKRLIAFPGHDYTSELLHRQLQPNAGDSCKWKNFAPSDFFETVSQYYVANHRRTLPHSSGLLLTVPTPISRELQINPIFRAMKKRGQSVIRAIRLWYNHFALGKEEDASVVVKSKKKPPAFTLPPKSPSRPSRWNVDAQDLGRGVFTTVYTADMEAIVDALQSGKLSGKKAAKRLKAMRAGLDEPLVGRRPVPEALPSDKNIYRAVFGMAMLGSRPSGLTLADSRSMKLPAPIDSNSDRLRINKKRLITVLNAMDLLNQEEEGDMIVTMIDLLWREANLYGPESDENNAQYPESYNATDAEASTGSDDVSLGVLKWMLFGVEVQQPSWFSRFCMPCGQRRPQISASHPASNMRQKNGELIRHDPLTCWACRNATGCPEIDGEGKANGSNGTTDKSSLGQYASGSDDEGDDNEIETVKLSILKEA